MSLVICYKKNVLCGGLGDRIVGLISIKVMSKLLNRNFYICWDKEDVTKYVNYTKYDFNLLSNISNDVEEYNYIDNQLGLTNYLTYNDDVIFPNLISKFYLNQEISQYLHQNKLYKDADYLYNIYETYKSLYSDILQPTEYLLEKINKLICNKHNIIGIQLRCGDTYMKTNIGEQYDVGISKNIISKLLKIKEFCEQKYKNYYIFITSDYDEIYEKTMQVFNISNIIYNNELIQHIDRPAINEDISKVFVDNYILSQKTVELFISNHSNFGRVAALSCIHENIYDYDCNSLVKSDLLSKHKLLSK